MTVTSELKWISRRLSTKNFPSRLQNSRSFSNRGSGTFSKEKVFTMRSRKCAAGTKRLSQNLRRKPRTRMANVHPRQLSKRPKNCFRKLPASQRQSSAKRAKRISNAKPKSWRSKPTFPKRRQKNFLRPRSRTIRSKSELTTCLAHHSTGWTRWADKRYCSSTKAIASIPIFTLARKQRRTFVTHLKRCFSSCANVKFARKRNGRCSTNKSASHGR